MLNQYKILHFSWFKCQLVSITTARFTQQNHWGLSWNKITRSLRKQLQRSQETNVLKWEEKILFMLQLQDNETRSLNNKKTNIYWKEKKKRFATLGAPLYFRPASNKFHAADRFNQNCNKILEFVWKSDATNTPLQTSNITYERSFSSSLNLYDPTKGPMLLDRLLL